MRCLESRFFVWSLVLLTASFFWITALPAGAVEGWLPGPDMSVGRSYFGLVTLPSGDLLAPGGIITSPVYTNRVDLFSVIGSTFSETTAMPVSHRNPLQALLLGNGKVLVAGEQYDGIAKESHLFTESTHSWAATVTHPTLNRFGAAMTLLPNGKVLYTGGYNGAFDGPTYDSAELFDPTLSTWSSTGSMVALRVGHTMTLLVTGPNAGKVLVAGGGQRVGLPVEARCELYDPATGTFALTGSLHSGRTVHTATRLLDGRVLVTGGRNAGLDTNNQSSVEIYDPVAGTWALAAPMSVPRALQSATLLPNGDVLVVGGARVGNGTNVNASAEIYHPATDTWRAIPALSTPRAGPAAALLPGGRVLVAGGFNGTTYVATSEIFQALSALPVAAAGSDQTVRPGSLVQLDGGGSTDDVTAVANLVFAWTLTGRPAGSTAVLSGGSTATPSFLADLPGVYLADLVVTDEDGQASSADQVQGIANAAPTAVAQAGAMVVRRGTPVALVAAGSSDPEGDALTYQWTLSSTPPGSLAVLANAGTALATLTPDVAGTYGVTLTVSDFLGAGAPVNLTITAEPSPVEIPALSKSGALLLAALLAIGALVVLRRRSSVGL